MKKSIILFLLATMLCSTASIAQQNQKVIRKTSKNTVKKLKKDKWENYESAKTLDLRVKETLTKLSSPFYEEVSATAFGETDKQAVAKARNIAIENFYELQPKQNNNPELLELGYIVVRKLRKKPYEALCVFVYDADKARQTNTISSVTNLETIGEGVFVRTSNAEKLYGAQEELNSCLAIENNIDLAESADEAACIIEISCVTKNEELENNQISHGYILLISVRNKKNGTKTNLKKIAFSATANSAREAEKKADRLLLKKVKSPDVVNQILKLVQ